MRIQEKSMNFQETAIRIQEKAMRIQEKLKDMKFWKETKKNVSDNIHEGALFQKKHAYNMIEIARVVSVSKDRQGIPHVKYEVKFERPAETGRSFEGQRVLALSVFSDNYKAHVEPS